MTHQISVQKHKNHCAIFLYADDTKAEKTISNITDQENLQKIINR